MATTTGTHGFNSKVSLGGNSVQYGVGDFIPVAPPVVPPQTQTLAMAFGTTSADTYEYARLGVSGTVDLSAAQLVNVASVVFRLNGSTVTGSQSVTFGDNLVTVITRTVAGQQSGVSLSVVPTTAVQSITVPTTQWATWQDLTNMSLDSAEYEDTKNGLVALTGADASFVHSARSVQFVTGPGWVEFQPLTYNVFFGLNYQGASPTFGAAHFTRMRYALFVSGNATTIYQNGSAGSPIVTGAGNFAKKYRIRDTGSQIVYEYSNDRGATWLGTTPSLQSYLAQPWQADVCSQFLNAPIRGAQLSL